MSKSFVLALLAFSVHSFSAGAQTEAPASVTGASPLPPSAALTTTAPATTEKFRATYFGDLSVPTGKTETGDWYHEPGLDYKAEFATIKMKIPFTTYASPNKRQHLTEFEDVSAGLARVLVKGDLFGLYGGFNLNAPTSDDSRAKQRRGSLGVTLIPASTFNTTNVKLEWLTLLKAYAYRPNEELDKGNLASLNQGTMSQYKAEFYPALTYMTNDRLGAVLGGHLVFYNSRNKGLNEWVRVENALHAGFSYKVAQALSIRPELRLPDPAKWNSDTVEAGMLFFGSL